MPDKVPYEYAIIRLVPKVEREEFLNIGVILFCKRKKYLNLKYYIDQKKIKAFTDELDVSIISTYLQTWEMICQAKPAGGPISEKDQAYRFRWLASSRSSIIQCSKAHPGLCNEPADILDKIFSEFVL